MLSNVKQLIKGLSNTEQKKTILKVIRELKRCDCDRKDDDVIKQLNENKELN